MRKRNIIALFLGVMLLVSGCVGQYPDTPEGTYAQSLTVFNDSVEAYYNTLVTQTPEIKAQWKKDINPSIHTAGVALDVWRAALGTANELDKQHIYVKLWRDLWKLLITTGIIKVEE